MAERRIPSRQTQAVDRLIADYYPPKNRAIKVKHPTRLERTDLTH